MSDRQNDFQTLIEQLRNGSDEAAHVLLKKYSHHVLLTVRRQLRKSMRAKFDSQDFTQAVWASFFENREEIARFDSPERLIRFLVQMAANKVTDGNRRYLGSQKCSLFRECSVDELGSSTVSLHGPFANIPTPSEAAVGKEQWERIMDRQPAAYQRMLELRAAGCKYTEIAAELGVDERTVRRIIRRLGQKFEP